MHALSFSVPLWLEPMPPFTWAVLLVFFEKRESHLLSFALCAVTG